MNLTRVCRVDGVSRVGAGCSHKYVECVSVEYSCWSSITLNRCRKITFYIHTALLTFSVGLRYLVKLVHAEATNFGLDVFAHVFGGRQKATLGLKPQNTTHTDTHRHRNWVTITVTQWCDVASGSSARANESRVLKTAASGKPPFQNTRTSVAEPRERCEPEYLDLDAEGRSVCRLVEDRICQVGETQSAAAVDVHHLVTAPRCTKRNLSSFACSARYFSSIRPQNIHGIQADWFVWLFFNA